MKSHKNVQYCTLSVSVGKSGGYDFPEYTPISNIPHQKILVHTTYMYVPLPDQTSRCWFTNRKPSCSKRHLFWVLKCRGNLVVGVCWVWHSRRNGMDIQSNQQNDRKESVLLCFKNHTEIHCQSWIFFKYAFHHIDCAHPVRG